MVSNADGRVESFLRHVGITKYLDFVVDSGLVGVEKPDPRIFEIALERAQVRKDEVVHVGDVYEVDVVGARAAGIEPWTSRAVCPESRKSSASSQARSRLFPVPSRMTPRGPRSAPT